MAKIRSPRQGTESVTDWGTVTAKALAVLAVQVSDVKDKTVTERATFLMNLGLSRRDAAALLGTTDNSLAVMLGRTRKKASAKSKASATRARPKRKPSSG